MHDEQGVLEENIQEDEASDSLYRKVGELLGFKSPIACEIDLVDRLEKGLAAGVVHALRTRAGLSDEEIHQLIAPRRTLNRRHTEHQVLSRDEADRVVRVARIVARAQQVFGAKPVYAMEWLRSAQRGFGDRTPIQMLVSDSGARAVEELLIGIGHGQFG